MADVSKIKLGSTTYNIKDTNAAHGAISNVYYGICGTSSDTVNKEVIILDPNITELSALPNQTLLIINFSNKNVADDPKIIIYNNAGTEENPVKGDIICSESHIAKDNTIGTYGGMNTFYSGTSIFIRRPAITYTNSYDEIVTINSWELLSSHIYNNVTYGTCTFAYTSIYDSGVYTVTSSIGTEFDGNGNSRGIACVKFLESGSQGGLLGLTVPYMGGTKPIKLNNQTITDPAYFKVNDIVVFLNDGDSFHIIGKNSAPFLTKVTSSVAGATSVSVTVRNNRVSSSDDYLLTFATNVTALTDSTSLSV